MLRRRLLLWLPLLGVLLQGCCTFQTEVKMPAAETQVDFTDPVLKRRQILLFGPIDQRTAERTIKELLFLEGESHEPIDLYLQTPGGELKHSMAIEQVMRRLKSPVNTYALSECNSGGALLLTAGTGKRRAFQGAVVILHGMKVSGRPPQELIDRVQDSYTQFWRQRAHLPEPWLPMPHGVLHILSAEQALRYGIVDEVVER